MWLSPYSEQEVNAILVHYFELRMNHVGPFSQVRLMDIDRCMKQLNSEEKIVLFLYGMCDETSREAAVTLGISHTTVQRQFVQTFAKLCQLMNGEYEQ